MPEGFEFTKFIVVFSFVNIHKKTKVWGEETILIFINWGSWDPISLYSYTEVWKYIQNYFCWIK